MIVEQSVAMRGGIVFLAAIALAGCEKPKDWMPTYPPEYFSHWSDRMKERFPELQTTFGPSCLWANWETQPIATEKCFRMTEPKRWTGLWRNDFEGSRFCPDDEWEKASECSAGSPGRRIWLYGEKIRAEQYSLYRVEFIGRRTLYEGEFGHMGMFNHEMVVDQMISMKQIEPPPPQPTKAQMVAYMRACEANRTCIPNWDAINQMDDSKK